MAINFSMEPEGARETIIKVVGVGGGGGNAVNRMVVSGMKGVEFISLNTDAGALNHSHATYKLNIGERLTKGQGAGGNAEKGQRAAEESRDEIAALLKGTDMVFITAGMGGGTGTGGAPIVAQIAHDMGILTIGVVTKPFNFEGRRRMDNAELGITALREHVDALLVIPNERLRQFSTEKITLQNAFGAADEVLRQGVQSIAELINVVGTVNLDFEDVKTIMKDAGNAHMGVGRASGKDKAKVAAENAISSPLLETSINGARGVIVNFTAPEDISLDEMATASDMISQAAHPDVNLIWGVAFDSKLQDEVIITVIATGFDHDDDFTIPSYNFKSPAKEAAKSSAAKAPAPTAPLEHAAKAAEEAPAPAPIAPLVIDDDEDTDPFIQIMEMFKRK
ncbi:MAG: cell division protein FtsZ [Oscillospiraceae bacterium]